MDDEPPQSSVRDQRSPANERWLQVLVEHGADVITLHNDNRRVTYAAPSLTRILGYSVEECVSMAWADIVHPDDAAELDGLFTFLLATPSAPRHAHFRLRHKTGAWRWMEATGVNLLLDPNVRSIVINQHDVTIRRETEEALRQSEQRFRALVENSEDGIELATARGTILYVSRSTERLLGRSADEIVGRNVFELVHHEDRERLSDNWQRALDRPGVAVRAEFRHPHPSGHDKFIETVRVNHLADPGLRAIVTIYRDVSERRALEEQVRQSQKMEAIGRLAGGIAHDFNNILSAIHGFATIIRGELPARDPLRMDVDEILNAVDRAAVLTRQLLAFGRRQVLQPQPLSVGAYLLDLDRMLRRVIGEDIELTIRVDDDTAHAKADPSQLEQVILNLVVNARDSMPTGGRLIIEAKTVLLDEDYASLHSEVVPGVYACMSVTDTGSGMKREVQERIFEPFFTTKQTGQGTGLGLSTVFGIVKQSGGHITVHSEPGHGSTFKIFFPTTAEISQPHIKRRTHMAPARGTETILLVEDEAAVRSFLARSLRKEGYQVLDASNGGEALLIAEQHPGVIHLLLTDVVMPRLSGRQLADRLLAIRPKLRVLYVSGYAEAAIIQQGILSPGSAFVEKPIAIDSLARTIRELLDRPDRTPAPRAT